MSNQNDQVIDWTVHALDKFASDCVKRGDYAEASIIDTANQLYSEGLVSVKWDLGQPVFSLTGEARMLMDVMKGTPEATIIDDVRKTLEDLNGNQ